MEKNWHIKEEDSLFFVFVPTIELPTDSGISVLETCVCFFDSTSVCV
jgi:hypothetical protein